MKSGGPVDPVTGRPLEDARLRPSERERSEKARLEKAAAFLPVAESEAAKTLTDLIEAVLYARVSELVEKDPECSAVLSILKVFATQRDYAKYAVVRLIDENT